MLDIGVILAIAFVVAIVAVALYTSKSGVMRLSQYPVIQLTDAVSMINAQLAIGNTATMAGTGTLAITCIAAGQWNTVFKNGPPKIVSSQYDLIIACFQTMQYTVDIGMPLLTLNGTGYRVTFGGGPKPVPR